MSERFTLSRWATTALDTNAMAREKLSATKTKVSAERVAAPSHPSRSPSKQGVSDAPRQGASSPNRAASQGASSPNRAASQGAPSPNRAASQGAPSPNRAASQGASSPNRAASQGAPSPNRAASAGPKPFATPQRASSENVTPAARPAPLAPRPSAETANQGAARDPRLPPPQGAARDPRLPPPQAASVTAPPGRDARTSAPPARSNSAPPAADNNRSRGRPRGPFTQHRRLDALRALLQRHPKGLTIYELARELDVTPRSMRRYLAEVRREMEITPTQSRPGGERVWRLAPGELGRRVEVRRTQAYALLAAQRLFEPMKGSTLYEEIDMVAQKLLGVARRPGRGPNAGVADARLEERFLYLPFAPKDYSSRTEELDALFQAVADLRPLKCRYRRAKDGREERIVIHPYAMVLYKDSIYCVGLHVGRGDIRTFLLDRMRDAECASIERFSLPDDFSIDDHFQGQFGIFRGGEPKNIVIDFDPKVAEYVRTRRVHPSQQLAPLANGGVRLSMAIGDLTEVGTWILGFGETAKVIEPIELVERVKKELSGALTQYG